MNNIILNKLKSSKISLLIISAFACALNVYISINLITTGFNIKYYIFPIVLAIINLLYFLYAMNSNFRFKYTIIPTIVYILAIFSAIFPIVYNSFIFTGKIISYSLSIMWIIIHTLLLIILILSFIKSKFNHNLKSNIWNFLVIAFVVCIGSILLISSTTKGIFGQGINKKTIVYEQNLDGTYNIADILVDYNDTVVIIDEFNNKKITGFNCDIFNRIDINVIIFDRNEPIKFYNYSNILSYNKNIEFFSNKQVIDDLKSNLYNTKNNEMIKVANNIVPNDILNDEVYINFTYSKDTLEIIKYKVLPTWIGKNGDKFNYDIYNDEYNYTSYIDCNSFKNLNWNYDNNGYILSSLDINNRNIIKNESYEIKFDKIYKIIINDDNDLLFEADDEYKYSYIDSTEYKYKLATLNNINNIFEKYPKRLGFELKYMDNEDEIGNIIDYVLVNDITEITINPIWTMKNPVIEELISNNEDNTFTYGDFVKLESQVDVESDDILLEYSWMKGNELLYKGSNSYLDLPELIPNDSGEYTLSVKAYSNNSSLSSIAFDKLVLTINKKVIDFSWNLPESNTYDAIDKEISVSYDVEQLVRNDQIIYDLYLGDIDSDHKIVILDANSYNLSIELGEDSSELYEISHEDKDILYEIKKREIKMIWDETSLIHEYDGLEYCPKLINIDNLIEKEKDLVYDSISYSPNNIYANTYKHIATISNPNYVIVNPEIEYVIEKKSLTINWDTNNSFVYDGTEHIPSYTKIDGALITEEDDVINSITLSGKQRNYNKDNYICTAKTSNTNYFITNPTCEFSISKKTINVIAKDVSVIYGNEKELSYDADLLINNDTFSGSLNREEGIDVGEYIINQGSLTAGDNYEIIFTKAIYKIEPRQIEITWDDNNFYYTGQTQKINASYIDINNVKIDMYINIDKEFINVGSYKAYAYFKNEEKNYILPTINYKNYDIKIATNSFTTEYKREGWVYGEVPNNVSEEPISLFGTPTIKYYTDPTCSTEYTDGFTNMTNAGTYYVLVSVDSTSNYKGLSKIYQLKIDKKEITNIHWSEDDYSYTGVEQNILAKYLDIDGILTDLSISINKKFMDVGEYTVTANLNNEDLKNYYFGCVNTKNYTMKKGQAYWHEEFSISSYIYGDNFTYSYPTYKLDVNSTTKKGDANIKFYKESSCENSIVLNSVTPAGTYYVKAYVNDTTSYNGITKIYQITVDKREITVNIDNKNSIYGEDLLDLSYIIDGEVKKGDDLGIVLTKEVGNDVGEYKITGTCNNPNYNVIFVEGIYTISIANTVIKNLSIDDWYHDQNPNSPTANSNFGEIIYSYSDNIDGIYSETVPSNIGKYYLKATVIGTNNYTGATEIIEFEILDRSS